MNIRIIIFSCFILFGCKPLPKGNIRYTKNCFYKDQGYVYLNFYNSGDQDILFPEIFMMVNKDFTLIENYYDIKSDTLYMRTPDENDISITDIEEPNVKFIRDSIEVKKGDTYRKIFKLSKDFKTIVLKNGDASFVLENCGYK